MNVARDFITLLFTYSNKKAIKNFIFLCTAVSSGQRRHQVLSRANQICTGVDQLGSGPTEHLGTGGMCPHKSRYNAMTILNCQCLFGQNFQKTIFLIPQLKLLTLSMTINFWDKEITFKFTPTTYAWPPLDLKTFHQGLEMIRRAWVQSWSDGTHYSLSDLATSSQLS